MLYEKITQEHYKKEALDKGLSEACSMHDTFVRSSEINFILEEIDRLFGKVKKPLNVLEIGCGNGYLLSVLVEKYPDFSFSGVEFSKELFDLAQSRNLKKVNLINGDCRKRNFEDQFFDLVISERVMINLLDNEDKLIALRSIHQSLKPGGRLVMIESFTEPLAKLNKARREFMMDEIKPAYHNEYFTENLIKKMISIGFVELEGKMGKNFLSTHYFLTRVLHEAIRPEGGEIRNTEFVRFFDQIFPAATGDYSPLLFRIFEKRGS